MKFINLYLNRGKHFRKATTATTRMAGGGGGGDEKLTRIAIVSSDKCKPKKCRQECKKSCPVVKMGKWISLQMT
jgi:hypothetical protein